MNETASEFDPAWVRSFRRRLVAWYGKHGRSLPWRESRDPYRVWVSEVMLQQTTVAAVVPYYERFLARFPTVQSLAAASEHDVLRQWEGLGYYSRARNMHAAAKRIVAEHGGAFPRTLHELTSLHGIGRYTAGAIASFAFDEPAPIVEANTLRLYSRLLAYSGDPRSTAGQKRLWALAGQIVPDNHAGRFNHALMDLGATVCTVKQPKCETCPVRRNCRAFEAGSQHSIPALASRPAVTDVTEAYIVVRKGDEVLLRRRSERERWAGLWDFPRCELPGDAVFTTPARNGQQTLPLGEGLTSQQRDVLEDQVASQTGIRTTLGEPFAELRHGVTRFRIRVICFEARYQSGRVRNATTRWVKRTAFDELALSRTGRQLAERLAVTRR
ncbi:MAG: A/G-specific adenine glycosylase [Planctomycetaceae bacterium]